MTLPNLPLIIANWKLYRNFQETLEWCTEYRDRLTQLAKRVTIIICPETTTLALVSQLLEGTGVGLGAQYCSLYEKGAYTGAISALSLSQIGCSACIVGHHEQRTMFNIDDTSLAQTALLLEMYTIMPIVCIGEQQGGKHSLETLIPHLKKQLQPLVECIAPRHDIHASSPLCIAYEPAWAIGSQKTPDAQLLTEVGGWLRDWGSQNLPHSPLSYLYGGGISPQFHISQAKNAGFDGLLIGHASLDIQNLEKIVS